MSTDRGRFRTLHGRWCGFAVLAVVTSIVGYVLAARGAERWPGGGSSIGLAYGALAALIVCFEFALWPKRSSWFRTARWLGGAETWMRAHLWLGILSLPLVVMHSGFRLGGSFSTLLGTVFYGVIASGVAGWFLQTIVPRLIWEQVPRETIFGEIDSIAGQYAAEASRIVTLTCGGDERASSDSTIKSREADEVAVQVARAGAARRVGAEVVRDRAGRTDFVRAPLAGALAQAFDRDIRPFLLDGRNERRSLGESARNRTYFESLRSLVSEEAWPAVAAIEDLCESRRQLDLQRRWHRLLHGWLWVHLPLSAVLVVLLAAHVIFALRYS